MSNVKPHQFDKDKKTYVECTSEQREEILRIAKEYGRKVYYETPNSGSEYRNLVWGNNDEYIWGTRATFNNDPKLNWLPYSEFVARLKGEWTPEVKPEVKPHQFDKSRDTCVKCTPEQRAEIIRIARELGRGIYDDNNIENEINEYPNLYWSCNARELDGLSANGGSPRDRFVSYEEFVARLKGEWVEEEQKSDHSHLIGKWVKVVDICAGGPKIGEWVQVEDFNLHASKNSLYGIVVKWGEDKNPDKRNWHQSRFDLSNPLDHNPDEKQDGTKAYYNAHDKEVIDMMIDIYGTDAVINFCKCNALKYRFRAGYKSSETIESDIQKALWYENKAKELSSRT